MSVDCFSAAAASAAVVFCGTLAHISHVRVNYVPMVPPKGSLDGHTGENSTKPLRVLFVGDSLCLGVGADRAAPFQAACADRLAAISGRSVGWRTIADDGADVRRITELVAKVELRLDEFDFAIVLCGVNDYKQMLTCKQSPARYRRDLIELCSQLRRKAPNCPIILPCCLGLFYCPPRFQSCLMRTAVGWTFDRFEVQKTRVILPAETIESPVLPPALLPPPANKALWGADGIHPSTKGYQVIGEWVARILEQWMHDHAEKLLAATCNPTID